MIFEDTPDRQKTVMPTGFQILNQIKPLEEANVEPVEEAINQLVTKGQCNLRLWANISKTKCRFQRGIMSLDLETCDLIGWKCK